MVGLAGACIKCAQVRRERPRHEWIDMLRRHCTGRSMAVVSGSGGGGRREEERVVVVIVASGGGGRDGGGKRK